MEAAFNKLKEKGKNTVDGVLEWMKAAKLVDGKTVTDDDVKECFKDADQKQGMDFETFRKGLLAFCARTKQGIDQISKTLTENVDKFLMVKGTLMGLMKAGAGAVQSVMKK